MLKKLIFYYLCSFFKPTYVLCIVGVFVLNGILVHTTYGDLIPNGYANRIVFMFYMPLNIQFDLLRWLLIFIPILLFFSSFILRELRDHPTYLILRMKSYRHCFHSMFIAICISLVGTVGIAYGVTGMVIFFFNSQIEGQSNTGLSLFLSTNGWQELLNHFTLFILTLLLLLIVHTIFSFIIHNAAFAMFTVIISMIASATIGYLFPSLLKFLPLTYFLLGLREMQEVTSAWSNSIILLCIVLSYCVLSILFINLREKIVGI
ncbi:hypothetical protein FH508_0010885 [Lysinibacillus sp. CD3-6]|uniref:hypothetical protein n=1 Tax=Lysinibacillus sp. CD3-6 TaxID=2892541 RepID=UPI00116729BF|nr:hypothetical protein [Lysinibacillus sp. CD3-6]UED82375.1 hypothetical protein FH508_0010885 [Lysinibacillus sp. CD3-6]